MRRSLEELDTGEAGQPVRQLVLEGWIAGFWRWRLPLLVVPVTAAHGGGRVVADREPCLRARAHLEVIGCPGTAHLGPDQAGIDGVAENSRPGARGSERERDDVELALGVRLRGVPAALGPVDVPKGPGTCLMHPAAEIDEPVWSVDQRGEHVRGEGVHGEGLRVALRSCAAGRLEEDARVVN